MQFCNFLSPLKNFDDLENRLAQCAQQPASQESLGIALETRYGRKALTVVNLQQFSEALELSPLFHTIRGQEDADQINRIKNLIGKIYPFQKGNLPILAKVSSLFKPLASPFLPFCPEERAKLLSELLPKAPQERAAALQAVATSLYLEKVLKVFCQRLITFSDALRLHEPVYGLFLEIFPAPIVKDSVFFPLWIHLFEKISKAGEEFDAAIESDIENIRWGSQNALRDMYKSVSLRQKQQQKAYSFLQDFASKNPLPAVQKIKEAFLKFLKVQNSVEQRIVYHTAIGNASEKYWANYSENPLLQKMVPHLHIFSKKQQESVQFLSKKVFELLNANGSSEKTFGENVGGFWICQQFFGPDMLLRQFGQSPKDASDAFYLRVRQELTSATQKASLSRYRKIGDTLNLPFLEAGATLPSSLEEELPSGMVIESQEDSKESFLSDEKEFGPIDDLPIHHPRQVTKQKKKKAQDAYPLPKTISPFVVASSSSSASCSSSASSSIAAASSSSIPRRAPFPFSYDQRVSRWWDPAKKPSEFPGYATIPFEYLETQILFHGFSRRVDAFYRIGREASFGKQRHTQYTIPAELVYKGLSYRGIITYTIDKTDCCYHRYFHVKSFHEWFSSERFYAVDFPTIEHAYSQRAKKATVPEPLAEEDAEISYDAELGVVTIEDAAPENLDAPVTIRLFGSQGTAFATEEA